VEQFHVFLSDALNDMSNFVRQDTSLHAAGLHRVPVHCDSIHEDVDLRTGVRKGIRVSEQARLEFRRNLVVELNLDRRFTSFRTTP
jgi:hypothetical protein